jgi:predicted permease
VGASGRRILAQLLTENLLLFAIAGALSALLIHWLADVAAASGPVLPEGGMNVEVDGTVVGFVLTVVLATGLTFGLIPAFHASRPNLVRALKGREAPPRFRFLGIRNLLVGAQVGGSLFLVLVSLLLAQSLTHARQLDLGFEDRGVAVVELDLSFRDYSEAEGHAFFEELLARATALPGVSSAALASGIPLRGSSTYLAGIEPEGYVPAPDEWVAAGANVVTPEYMELMGIEVVRGRGVDPADRSGGEPVLVVSQAFVDRYWPGESGTGKTVRSGADVLYRVTGVVEDISWRMPGERPEPFLWIPFEQSYGSRMVLHAQTDGDPGALLQPLRSLVAEMDPALPIVRLDRLETLTANATQVHRILSGVLGFAGGVTLLLAMLGIYGIVAFSVSQRIREVGLRVAIGAEPRQVVRMVLREGMTLAVVGLVPGVLLSIVAAQLMRGALMGLEPLSPLVFGGGVGLLLLSVALASWIPARKAARCDPMIALRED